MLDTPLSPVMRTVLTAIVAGLCAGGLVAGIVVLVLAPATPQDIVEAPKTDEIMGDDGGGTTTGLEGTENPIQEPGPSSSKLFSFDYGAVAVDSVPCAKIGKDILVMGGTAVDAAIAVLFCNGVANPMSMGIGGGFIMTISLANGTRQSLVAREMAPLAAHPYMYKDNSTSSTVGALSAAVPGEVKGYWEAKQRFGNPAITWRSLVQPTIDLCRQGMGVSPVLARYLKKTEESVMTDPGLRSVFSDPKTGKVWREGDKFTHPVLAKTLEVIAAKGSHAFYRGEIAKKLVDDIAKGGGIVNKTDLENYRVRWESPVTVRLPGTNLTILTSPPPTSGSIVASILATTAAFQPQPRDRNRPLFWHRFTEACKYAYARRTMLGDWANPDVKQAVTDLVANLTSQQFNIDIAAKISDMKTEADPKYYGADFYQPEDSGTAHMSIVSPAGDAVSVTSTVNLLFGSKYMSPQTGIILNNQMDDFSYPDIINAFGVPPSITNFVAPGRRPVSSMSPTIILDDRQRVVAVLGASGGTKIITSVAQVALRLLFLGDDVKSAVDARRIHHQLMPMELFYESGVPRWTVEGLQRYGHHTTKFPLGGSIVQALFMDPVTGKLTGNADFRKGGSVEGF